MPPAYRQSETERLAAETWESLLRVHAALTPLLSGEVEARAGVPLSWYDVLLELSRAEGNRLRMQDLGERVVLSRSRASRIVDDVEAAGLVVRESDPGDGRVALAKLTARGKAALRGAAPVYLAAISTHFGAHMTAAEMRSINRGLTKVLEALESR